MTVIFSGQRRRRPGLVQIRKGKSAPAKRTYTPHLGNKHAKNSSDDHQYFKAEDQKSTLELLLAGSSWKSKAGSGRDSCRSTIALSC